MRKASVKERVKMLIRVTRTGITCEQIEEELGLRHQSASARVNELVDEGYVMLKVADHGPG